MLSFLVGLDGFSTFCYIYITRDLEICNIPMLIKIMLSFSEIFMFFNIHEMYFRKNDTGPSWVGEATFIDRNHSPHSKLT